MILLLLAGGSSWAAAPCSHALTDADLRAQLDAFDAAIANFELERATTQLKATHAAMLCLDRVAPPDAVGRLARQLALTFFFDQDEDATRRWGLLQRYSAPDLPWGDDFGEDHPFREALADAEDPIQGTPRNKTLAPPKKGGIFVNGRFLAEASYYAEVPAFVQVADKKGEIVDQFWQDGAAFPDRILIEGSGAAVAPKWWEGPAEPVAVSVAVADVGEPEEADEPEEVEAPEDVEEPQEVEAPEDVEEPQEVEEPVETVAAEAPEPPAPEEPAAPPVAPPPALPTLLASALPDDYVDPFEDARLRAIARETTVREEDDRTVVTEVTTFAVVTGGESAVLQRDFAEFIGYQPEWKRDAAITEGRADKDYMKSWKGGTAPKPDAPITGVPFGAAKAYCDQWSQGLALHAFEAPQQVPEWRAADDGSAVRRLVDGTVEAWTGSEAETVADTGFRCVD